MFVKKKITLQQNISLYEEFFRYCLFFRLANIYQYFFTLKILFDEVDRRLSSEKKFC